MRGKKKNKNTITYELVLREDAMTKVFTDEEKEMLRPIAETISMLDGNAFLSMDLGDGRQWYEQYLPEAWTIFENNGGTKGWPADASWVRDLMDETPAVVEARRSLKVALVLSRK